MVSEPIATISFNCLMTMQLSLIDKIDPELHSDLDELIAVLSRDFLSEIIGLLVEVFRQQVHGVVWDDIGNLQ